MRRILENLSILYKILLDRLRFSLLKLSCSAFDSLLAFHETPHARSVQGAQNSEDRIDLRKILDCSLIKLKGLKQKSWSVATYLRFVNKNS